MRRQLVAKMRQERGFALTLGIQNLNGEVAVAGNKKRAAMTSSATGDGSANNEHLISDI
jgi:hypothetical protein